MFFMRFATLLGGMKKGRATPSALPALKHGAAAAHGLSAFFGFRGEEKGEDWATHPSPPLPGKGPGRWHDARWGRYFSTPPPLG